MDPDPQSLSQGLSVELSTKAGPWIDVLLVSKTRPSSYHLGWQVPTVLVLLALAELTDSPSSMSSFLGFLPPSFCSPAHSCSRAETTPDWLW